LANGSQNERDKKLLMIPPYPNENNKTIIATPNENPVLEKLEIHLTTEKKVVEATINDMIKDFTILCNSLKEDIYQRIDSQVITLKANLNYFRTKMNSIYSKHEPDGIQNRRESLVKSLKNSKSVVEYEIAMKNLKNDIEEIKILGGDIQKGDESIKMMFNELKSQSLAVPKIALGQSLSVDEFNKSWRVFMRDYMLKAFELTEPIMPLSLGLVEVVKPELNWMNQKEKGYESEEEDMGGLFGD